MQISLNGVPREIPDGFSLAELLRQRQLSQAPIAVEVNQEIVPRCDHETMTIQPGDTIEIVTLVGGG